MQTILIVTWNIDRGTGLAAIRAALVKNPADLYIFQEVDWNTRRTGGADIAASLSATLHMNYSYGTEFEELSQEDNRKAYTGQATLTRLPRKLSRILRFQHQSSFWKPQAWLPSSVPLIQRRLGGRIALVDELQFHGRPLVVYNLHLESRSMGIIQAKQLDEVLEDLKQYPRDTPIVLAGDLNTKYFPSIFLRKLEHQGFRSCTGEKIEQTHTVVMALDWIFARGPVHLSEGKVRKDVGGSDHYPIYATLTAE